ncbi:MAG: hypothetical protein JXR48_07940 [Candidatus Delongbacteria bacterium]|nr:hypothetical protein [Candidatus Delongbacteria bacterium]MBN2834883.1 hypothetical protein [Candidatus Delongbacteria bacterium]
MNWREIINSFYEIQEIDNLSDIELTKFINYYERNYGMSNQKEILVQDVGVDNEIDRFFNGVYRRNKVNGSPLYFAPYFTRNSKTENEGILYISKILGIITTNDITWEKIVNSCNKFIDLYDNECEYKNELLDKWKKGISIDIDFHNSIESQKKNINEAIALKKAELEKNYSGKYVKSKNNLKKEIEELEEIIDRDENIENYWRSINYTYYFLNNPIELENPLVKDGGNKSGRGKNWIAAAIPQNRCVSFEDFISHSPLLKK